MPKVSVIIPTYNLSGLVGQTVESVLGQSVTDFELVDRGYKTVELPPSIMG